jgi:hypothetical protein
VAGADSGGTASGRTAVEGGGGASAGSSFPALSEERGGETGIVLSGIDSVRISGTGAGSGGGGGEEKAEPASVSGMGRTGALVERGVDSVREFGGCNGMGRTGAASGRTGGVATASPPADGAATGRMKLVRDGISAATMPALLSGEFTCGTGVVGGFAPGFTGLATCCSVEGPDKTAAGGISGHSVASIAGTGGGTAARGALSRMG